MNAHSAFACLLVDGNDYYSSYQDETETQWLKTDEQKQYRPIVAFLSLPWQGQEVSPNLINALIQW